MRYRLKLTVGRFKIASAYTGWPKKSKPPPIFQKIALKIANEIRFLCEVKV